MESNFLSRRTFLKLGIPLFGGVFFYRHYPALLALSKWRHEFHKGKIKSIIFITAAGGASQVDTFDYKPQLQKNHGQSISGIISEKAQDGGLLAASPFTFKQYGQSGQWASDIFPHLCKHIDELTFIKSMTCKSNNHGLGLFDLNCGQILPGRPSLGAWIHHAIGTLNPKLPGNVIMCDPRGRPYNGDQNWSKAFLSTSMQGLVLESNTEPLVELFRRFREVPQIPSHEQKKLMKLVAQLNHTHTKDLSPLQMSEAKEWQESFAMALELESHLSPILDMKNISSELTQLYGLDTPITAPYGQQLLWAKRLVEMGVRFVQIYHGTSENHTSWDSHEDIRMQKDRAQEIDRPLSGLLTDLKRSGLEGDVLVVWAGEFGKLPVMEENNQLKSSLSTTWGRDHNHLGSTLWLWNKHLKQGLTFGSTDELGYKAVEKITTFGDLHATLVHLLGINHQELKFHVQGQEFRLTEKEHRVLTEIIA